MFVADLNVTPFESVKKMCIEGQNPYSRMCIPDIVCPFRRLKDFGYNSIRKITAGREFSVQAKF